MLTLLKIGAAVALGAGLGGMLGSTRSCETGGCPLTATPRRGALWGGFIGLMFAASLVQGGAGRAVSEVAEAGGADTPIVEVVTMEQYEREVLGVEGPVAVYFHAPWCAACRKFGPEFGALARERADTALFAKIDTDTLTDLARDLNVMYLPTTVVFRDGREARRFVGAVSTERIAAALAEDSAAAAG